MASMIDPIPLPPDSLAGLVGVGYFEEAGQRFTQIFVEQGGLKPNERVLDIGCGVGRMARPLTKYLTENGEYKGFDIAQNCIEWCQSEITPRYQNFEFQCLDLYNGHYNPNGQLRANNCRFPYESNYFDFAFLTSVFTHMLLEDVDHYISEIQRVLKPGGRCLATLFLLNPESLRLSKCGASTISLIAKNGFCAFVREDLPESAIAYDEQLVRSLFQKHTLELGQIHFGSWCGRTNYLEFQDVIVAHKTTLP